MKRSIHFSLTLLLLAVSCSVEKESNDRTYLYPVLIGEKWGCIDQHGSMIIAPQFRSAEAFSDGMARVVFDEPVESVLTSNGYLRYWKWGFIDSTGKVAFTLNAKYVDDFFGDLAMINDQNTKRYPDTIKYVDKTGRVAIAAAGVAGVHFPEGQIRIRVNDSSVICYGKWGFSDKSDNWVIKPNFPGVGSFSEGLAYVRDDSCLGFIDTTGKMVIPCQFDKATHFLDGIAMVHIGGVLGGPYHYSEPGRWRYIDKSGRFLDDTSKFEAYEPFSEGLAAVKAKYKYGFINKNMEIVIPPEFTHVGGYMRNTRMVRGFHEGLCAASKESIDGKVGCIDTTGQFVIAPVFHTIEPFSGPLARAQKQNPDGKFQCGYINRKGEWIFIDDYEYPPPTP